MTVRDFIDTYFHHFNAGQVRKAAQSLGRFLADGGKIFLTLAGAMSTARLGKVLVPMINSGYIAGISCTGANLEEDVFLLTANSHYETTGGNNRTSWFVWVAPEVMKSHCSGSVTWRTLYPSLSSVLF